MNFKHMDNEMLFSIVNMKLRDEFEDLKSFCSYYDVSEKEIKERLEKIDYIYNEDLNKFISK